MNDTEEWASQIINELFENTTESKENKSRTNSICEECENSLHYQAPIKADEDDEINSNDRGNKIPFENSTELKEEIQNFTTELGISEEYTSINVISPILKNSLQAVNNEFQTTSSLKRQCKTMLLSSPVLEEFSTISDSEDITIPNCEENNFRRNLKLSNVVRPLSLFQKNSSKNLNDNERYKTVLSSSPFLKEFPLIADSAKDIPFPNCEENNFKTKFKIPGFAKHIDESLDSPAKKILFSYDHLKNEAQKNFSCDQNTKNLINKKYGKNSSKTLNDNEHNKTVLSPSPSLKEFPVMTDSANNIHFPNFEENNFRSKFILPGFAKHSDENFDNSAKKILFPYDHLENEPKNIFSDDLKTKNMMNNDYASSTAADQEHLKFSVSTNVPIHSKPNTPPIHMEKLEERNSKSKNYLEELTQEQISEENIKKSLENPHRKVYEDIGLLKEIKSLSFDEVSEAQSENIDYKIQTAVNIYRKIAEFFEVCFIVPIATFIISNIDFLEFVLALVFCSMYKYVCSNKSKIRKNIPQDLYSEKILSLNNKSNYNELTKTKNPHQEVKTTPYGSPKSILTLSAENRNETVIRQSLKDAEFKNNTKLPESMNSAILFESKSTQYPEMLTNFSESNKIEINTLSQLERLSPDKKYANPTETIAPVSSTHDKREGIESLIVFSEEEITTLNSTNNSNANNNLRNMALNTQDDKEDESTLKAKCKEQYNCCDFLMEELLPERAYSEDSLESMDILSTDLKSFNERKFRTNAVEASIPPVDYNPFIKETYNLHLSDNVWCCLKNSINISEEEPFASYKTFNSQEALSIPKYEIDLPPNQAVSKFGLGEIQKYTDDTEIGKNDIPNFQPVFPADTNYEKMPVKTEEEYKSEENLLTEASEKDGTLKILSNEVFGMTLHYSVDDNFNVNSERTSNLYMGNQDYFKLRWSSNNSSEKNLENLTEENQFSDSSGNLCNYNVNTDKYSTADSNCIEEAVQKTINEIDQDESSMDVSLEVNYSLQTNESLCEDLTSDSSDVDIVFAQNDSRNLKNMEDVFTVENKQLSKLSGGQIWSKFHKNKLSISYEQILNKQFQNNIPLKQELDEVESLDISLTKSKLIVKSAPNLVTINTTIESSDLSLGSGEEIEPLTNYFENEEDESRIKLIDHLEYSKYTDHFPITGKYPFSQYDAREVKLKSSEPFEVKLPLDDTQNKSLSSDSESADLQGSKRKKKRPSLKHKVSAIFRGWKGINKRLIPPAAEKRSGYKKHRDSA